MPDYEAHVTQASISLWHSAGAAVRVVRRSLRWWLVMLMLLLAAWLIADRHTAGLLREEYAKLEAAGEPLTVAELAPKIPRGEQNAADTYLLAFGFLPELDGLAFDQARADPAFARAYLVPSETGLRLLKEAAALEYSAFPTDWAQPPYTLAFPHFAKLRESARRLLLDATVLAEDGRPDEALASIAAILRMGHHATQEPTLIASLVGFALVSIGTGGLEEVLAISDPSPAACRELADTLAAIDFEPAFHRAMLAERAMGLDAFRRVRETGGVASEELLGLSIHPVVFDLYRTVGRPLLNLDELAFLEHMAGQIALSEASVSDRTTGALGAEEQDFAERWHFLSAMIAPIFSRAHDSVLRAHANLALGQVALAAKAYEAQHGRLPGSLEEIETLGWKLPLDPYTGDPLHYRRNKQAFLVWSVGPNLIDDGGTEFDRQQMEWSTESYDLLFTCHLERVKQERAETLQRLEQERQAEQEEAAREAAEAAQRSSQRGQGRRGAR